MYWHVLLGAEAEMRATVHTAQQQLAHLPGLHFTPLDRLHITIAAIGSEDDLTPGDIGALAVAAETHLAGLVPIAAWVQDVLYHPEAVVLHVRSGGALCSLRDGVVAATREVLGDRATEPDTDRWVPHVTIAYSTKKQPADHIIGSLGHAVREYKFRIEVVSLVAQYGAERMWKWQSVTEVRLRS